MSILVCEITSVIMFGLHTFLPIIVRQQRLQNTNVFFNHKQRHLNMTMYLCIVLICFVVLFYLSLIFSLFLFLFIMSSLKTHVSIGEL